MKKAGVFVVVLIASLIGALVALRMDRMLDRQNALNAPPLHDPSTIMPVQFSGSAPAAPFDFRAAAKRIMPAVVSVDKSEAWRDFWTDRVSVVNTATGSGVIITADGYIVTNNHVVEGAASITVRTSDGKTYEAKLIGRDPRSDLAVIKVDALNLKPAELADSSRLEVGEWVMAVGNPLGYSNTLSVGVVSSLNRSLQAGDRGTLLIDTIQTDAAINGGNSGGALTNDRGQVIGINTAIASPTGSNIGIGFAIPINRAREVVADILKYGRVRYGYSGFEVFNGSGALQDPRARRFILRNVGVEPPQKGLIVVELDPNSPAGRAGIKQLDVIQEADGKALQEPSDLLKIMLSKKVGDKLSLKLWSAGKERTVTLILSDTPQAN
jgi:S1-C subfamily serine protease